MKEEKRKEANKGRVERIKSWKEEREVRKK
jgi:hypothetical protein